MAAWTRTEDENYITFTRADNTAGWRVKKDAHCHAEQWVPWTECPQPDLTTAAELADWYQACLTNNGHTVT